MTMRKPLILAATVITTAAASIATVAIAQNDPSHTNAKQAITAALQAGKPTTLSSVDSRSLQTATRAGYAPSSAAARSVPAPTGDGTWTVIPTASGGACLIVDDGTLTCGSADSIASGRSGLIEIAPAPNDADLAKARLKALKDAYGDPKPAPAGESSLPVAHTLPLDIGRGGAATRKGIAPANAATVEALDKSGAVIHDAKVSDGLYQLALGTEGSTASVRFRSADGTVIATVSL